MKGLEEGKVGDSEGGKGGGFKEGKDREFGEFGSYRK